MEENNAFTNVARAILIALDWNSPPDAKKTAISFLDSFKTGDVHVLANTSFTLVKNDWQTEIRLHAFKMLQHLVRLRWEELNSSERRSFANFAIILLSEVAKANEPWALKSQASSLIAEMVRREGLHLWEELLPSLTSLLDTGPIQAELVSLVLRWLPEDITVHNEDLEGDRRRFLLRGITQSLPEILGLLYSLLGRHFEAALSELGKQHVDISKQHASTVISTLNAMNAYAEWAPLPDLAKSGIIYGCGCLLSSPDFRLHACEIFKLVSLRKAPPDDPGSEFTSAMSSVFKVLMDVTKDVLYKSSSGGIMDAREFKFAEYICESMVSLGTTNLQCVSANNMVLPIFLGQMLGYFQHFNLVLHLEALSFWLPLMRDLAAKPNFAANTRENDFTLEKKNVLCFVDDDICNAILDIAFRRLLRKEKVLSGTLSPGDLELWSDDVEGKGDFGQYHSRLVELIRLVASVRPIPAAKKASETILGVIKSFLPSKDVAFLESMQCALDVIVTAIFDGSGQSSACRSETQSAIFGVFEGLLHQLLSLKWTEPALTELLGRYFVSFGPFLKYCPGVVGSVINKLFELLISLPTSVKDPSTSVPRHARLHICSFLVSIAKAADKSLLPHMKGIADTMAYMQEKGSLLRAEHNLLGEACLVIASSAGVEQQKEVLAWLLEPLSKQWTQLEWQTAYLSEPSSFLRLCMDKKTMWSIFHSVTFFEKALKRSKVRKGRPELQNGSAVTSDLHPMAAHLSWMLPPLLKLLRAMHSLWSPVIFEALPGEMKRAMIMSEFERNHLVGENNPKWKKLSSNFSDESQNTVDRNVDSEFNENDVRNWLKGIRDSGYNVLGLAATLGTSFFQCLDVQSVTLSLMENIQTMEFRHIRPLVHSVFIPLVKSCPPNLWDHWMENLLLPLLLHCERTLSGSWFSLFHEGRAKAPDFHGLYVGADMKVEVIEEKLLRDLTREICLLLSVLGSPPLNPMLPLLEQSGHANREDLSSLKDLSLYSSSCLVGFILSHKNLALPAMKISLSVFTWTDGDATGKISCFCAAVILLTSLTNNNELQEFVSRDLFFAIIQGLSLESNCLITSDLVGLCRDIFISLADKDPYPKQLLLSLPGIKSEDLFAFEEALRKTSSPKEQKQYMRSLLLLASRDKLKALATQKTVNVITNVSARIRAPEPPREPVPDEGPLGLAEIL